MNATRLVLPLTAALCCSSASGAQTPLHAQFGDTSGVSPSFGHEAVASLGDVDGDGVSDYAVGAKMAEDKPGYVKVYSGGDARELATLWGNGVWFADPTGGSDRFGTTVAGIGDINGDLVPDLLVGAPLDDVYGVNRGVIQIFSGADWSLMREQTGSYGSFGQYVAALGDADGDGAPDYLVVEGGWRVEAYSGASGAKLWSHEVGFWDGLRLSTTTGDANGDGLGDALIGAPGILTSGNYARVLNGATGDEILAVSGTSSTAFGRAVTWLDDLNGDGLDDFAIGSLSATDSVTVIDSATATPLYTLGTNPPIGEYLCGLGDQNGDGLTDFAAHHFSGTQLRSGADGALIHVYDSMPMGAQTGGYWVASAGDLDGDGREDLLNTISGSGLGITGLSHQSVLVYSSQSHPFEDLGFAFGGAAADPTLSAEGAMLPGSLVRTHLWCPSGGAPAFLVVGLSAIHAPLLGGVMVPSLDFVIGGLSTGLSGHLDTWQKMPPGVPSGTTLYLQHWILSGAGPFGVTASNAVRASAP